MKTLILVLLSTLAALTAKGDLHLSEGNIFEYRFDLIPYSGTDSSFERYGAAVALVPTSGWTRQPEDVIKLELFEEDIEGMAAHEVTFRSIEQSFILTYDNTWADHDGSIRLTVLSGEFHLSEFQIIRQEETGAPLPDRYQLTVVPVPEPSTLALAVFGAAVLASLRRR